MSSVSTEPALGLDISQTYGAIVIGLLCAYFLYGATCVQTVLVFMNCMKDPMWIKCLVCCFTLILANSKVLEFNCVSGHAQFAVMHGIALRSV
jgi:hypothetical protein